MKKAKLVQLLLVALLILMILDFDSGRLPKGGETTNAGYEQTDSVASPSPADTQPNIDRNGR